MSRRRKIVILTAAALLVGLLFSAFALPLIVRGQLENGIRSATDRVCTVEKVSINPLNWSAEVAGVKLAEKNSNAVFASFSSLKLQVSPASIWRLAPVVSGVKIVSPYVHLRRNAANSYNFTDILAKYTNKPKKENDKPARFSLNNIVLENGRIEFDDSALAKPSRHTVENLSLQVPFISSISYFADKYIDPKLSARVNGAPFRFAGKLKPFDKGLAAIMNINLHDVDIPFYAPYFPEELPVQIKRGILSTALTINHRLISHGKPDIQIAGTAAVKELHVLEMSGATLFSLAAVETDIKQLSLLTRRYEINSLSIAAPHLSLHGNKDGVWNLSRLSRKAANAAPAEEKSTDSKTGKAEVSLQSLRLTDGTVSLRDERPPGGISSEFRNVTFNLDNFATLGELPASYSLSLTSGRNETASASGTIAMEPLAVSARIALTDIVHEAYYPYLLHILAEPVRGRIDCSGDLAYNSAKGLTLEEVMLRLKNTRVPFGKADDAKLPLIVAEGGSLKLKERTVSFAKVTASGGTVKLSRDQTGTFSTGLLLKEKPAAAAASRKEEGKPFSWKIGKIAVNGLNLAFTDGMKEDNPRFDFSNINGSLSSITGPKVSEMPLDLRFAYGAKGSVAAKGRIKGTPAGFKGDIVIKAFPFVDFDAYIPEGVNIALLDGNLDTKLFLDLAVKENKLTGNFRGEGGIREFYSVDAEEENDFLKWESLLLERFSGTFEPFTLSVSGVSLNNYYARVIVSKSGRTNLQDIYKAPENEGVAPAAPAEPQKPVKSRDIRVDAITFSGGTINFSDHHLNRDFSTTMLNLGGRISGLSSVAGTTADIDLRGNLENHSPLQISGRINPLAEDFFLDMTIDFKDIELSPLTPYSGTYLGYVIEKGKLSLAMTYKVDKKLLTAENKVFLDQFTFGDKVESPKATSLPVSFAVALLKDRNGEIHLDLPLSGRTDSPKFSIWGLVGQVLKNLLVKAATSPLALLQASFGGGADFSSVSFSSGSNRLTADEEDKLRSLAKALAERPGIRLEVMGFADRERDPEGYRSELLLKKMKSEKFLSLAKEKRESGGIKSDLVDIPLDEQAKWLKVVYEKEKFSRPRTVIGNLKSLPDEEMKKLILANTAVTDELLRGLARERALAVMRFLIEDGKLSQERLFEKSTDPFVKPEKGAAFAGRVEFGVVAR